jgi:hypothetical protein
MTLPTASEVSNMYLYGQIDTPNNLVDSNLIRSQQPGGLQPEMHINVTEYMKDGGGRFALGSQFQLVQNLFNLDLNDLPPPKFDNQGNLIGYAKAEFAAHFSLDRYWIDYKQFEYEDSIDDIGERTYIYNSSGFKLIDNIRFVVNPTGGHYIEHFAVTKQNSSDEIITRLAA